MMIALFYIIKNTNAFVGVVLQTFEKALEEIGKIPQLEPRILSDLYKTQKLDAFLKTPMKPREKLKDPDPNERPLKFPDENKWLWDMYYEFKDMMETAIKPLDDYLVVFNEYLPILKTNSEKIVSTIEAEDPPRDIESIKEEICKVRK